MKAREVSQTPTSQLPPKDDRELEQIKRQLIIEYLPPSAQPQSNRPRERWMAPPLYVRGRVPAPLQMQVSGAVVDPVEAAPYDPEAAASFEPKPEDAIRLALRHKRATFEHCFQQELRKQAVFNGFVTLAISVSAEGRVTQVRVVDGDRREKEVGACIAGQLRRLKLPVLAYDADLILPIRLEAKLPVS